MTSARGTAKARILVLSATFGGPHAEVARALARYLKQHRSYDTDVFSEDFLERALPKVAVLAKFGYQQNERFFPHGDGDYRAMQRAQPENPVVEELVNGGFERAARMIGELRPDVVISTFPLATALCSEMAADRGFFSAGVLTDFSARDAWLHPATDAYFVACKEVSDELVVRGVQWGRITVSGVPIVRVGTTDDKPGIRGGDSGLADRFTAVLAVPSGPAGDTLDIAARLAASGIQVAVMGSENPRLARQLETLARKSSLVRHVPPSTTAEELLVAADVMVCRAGGSALPLAVSIGVPLVVYNPVPGQEQRNVDFLVNSGAALLARDEQDAAEKTCFLSAHEKRRSQLAAESAALGRADAVQVVCERVLAAIG